MDVRLATFNLLDLGFREGNETPEPKKRLDDHVDELRATIRRLDADAVAFQEVLDPSLLQPLLEDLDYPHVALADRASSPLRLGVFSRYPLLSPRSVATRTRLSISDRKTGMEFSFQGAFSRPVLEVTWAVPGLETTLYVVHWKSKIPSFIPSAPHASGGAWESLGQVAEGRLVTEMKRLAQSVELRRVLDQKLRVDARARLAVLGDFNDNLASESLRIVRGDARACESPSLRHFELIPCELSVPRDLRYTHDYHGHREMIDHILISRGLKAHFAQARIFNELLSAAEEGPEPDLYSDESDHAPFVVTFRV